MFSVRDDRRFMVLRSVSVGFAAEFEVLGCVLWGILGYSLLKISWRPPFLLNFQAARHMGQSTGRIGIGALRALQSPVQPNPYVFISLRRSEACAQRSTTQSEKKTFSFCSRRPRARSQAQLQWSAGVNPPIRGHKQICSIRQGSSV